MAYPLIFIGLILVIVGVRDKVTEFGQVLHDDFTGSTNYVYWIVAVFMIGAIGVYKPLKPFSNAFLVLIVLVLLLKNGTGFFSKLKEQL